MNLNGYYPQPAADFDRTRAEELGGYFMGQSVWWKPADLAAYMAATRILDPNAAKAIERQTRPCAGCG